MSPTRPNPMIAQQQSSTTLQQQSVTIQPITVKAEPTDNSDQEQQHHQQQQNNKNDYDDKPTDLSMDVPTDLSSSSSRHVNIVCSPDTSSLRDPQQQYIKQEEKHAI